jgi:hypothetical protein
VVFTDEGVGWQTKLEREVLECAGGELVEFSLGTQEPLIQHREHAVIGLTVLGPSVLSVASFCGPEICVLLACAHWASV